MDVLLIGESHRGYWNLDQTLERLGCHCVLASTNEEVRTLLKLGTFPLVLSTRPVTKGSPLMELLRAPNRLVFYSFPVEDGCLWFQAVPEVDAGPRVAALRPGELMDVLIDFTARGR